MNTIAREILCSVLLVMFLPDLGAYDGSKIEVGVGNGNHTDRTDAIVWLCFTEGTIYRDI